MSYSRDMRAIAAIAVVAVLIAGATATGGEDKRLEPDTPIATIADRARSAPAPLWRLPLGTCYVDAMEPLEDGRLLVGLKSVARGIPNHECLLVDLSSGDVVWRMERRRKGDYVLLLASEGLLVFQVDEPERLSLVVVDAATGRERWSMHPEGRVTQFAVLPAGAGILLQNQSNRKFETAALRLADGVAIWRRSHELPVQAPACPAPLINGDVVLLFAGGTSRIDPRSGETLWSRTDITLDPDGAPPQFGGPGLLAATDGTLLALDLKSGETVWKAPLSAFASNIFPLAEAVYVRGDNPYRDPQGRFKMQVPPAWPLVWSDVNNEVFRFQDARTGAFILVLYHRSASGVDQPFATLLETLKGSLAVGSPRCRETQNTTVGGRAARWAYYEYQAKIEGSKEKRNIVSCLGVVFDPGRQAAVGFLSWAPAEDYDDLRRGLDRAFKSIRIGDETSVAERWRRRGQGSEALSHEITALNAFDGKPRWSVALPERTVSNIVVQDDRLYVATPRDLIALNGGTGARIFTSIIAESGRPFPVRLDLYENRVVFISELVIASCDSKTGARLYNHGMTPLSQETYIAGLDNTIPQFEEMVAKLQGIKIQGGQGAVLAAQATSNMRRYQNMSNHYAQVTHGHVSGNYGTAQLGKRFADQQAKWAANAAFIYSLADIGMTIYKLIIREKWMNHYEDILARQRLFRRSILSAYRSAEIGDYVYRPHLQVDAQGNGEFATISIVHLPTGRRRTTVLSPSYLEYGLWNWVDTQKGIVYHHGLGLDPSRYEYGESENIGIHGNVRVLKSFLIAVPLVLH